MSIYAEETNNIGPKILSVDVIKTDFDIGTVEDFLGCINASKKYKVVVYESRRQNLAFLKGQIPLVKAARNVSERDYLEEAETS